VKHLARGFVTSCFRGLSASRTFASVAPSDTSPNILERLPELLSHLVMTEWLILRDVVRLDSALCRGDWLGQALSLSHGKLTTFKVNPESCQRNVKAMLRWAVTKNVGLNGISIGENTNRRDRLRRAFLTSSGPEVRWIHSHIGSKSDVLTLFDVATRCPHTEKLTIMQTHQIPPSFREILLLLSDPTNTLDDTHWDRDLPVITQWFQRLTHLTLIHVENLYSEGLATALSHCQFLTELEIRDGWLDVPLEVAIPTLKSLTLAAPGVYDETLIAIGHKCADLETLRVFKSCLYNYPDLLITDVGLRAVLEGCPLLRETDVEHAVGISDDLRVELARRRDFKTLAMGDWSWMSDGLLQGVLRASPNLMELKCWCCEGLTDVMLAVCAQHCRRLTTLTLIDCREVTDGGVRAFVSVLTRLHALHFWTCEKLGEETVLAVAEHCPLLKELSCPFNASDAAVAVLAERCPHLTKLGFASTHELGDNGLIALATHCNRLKELYLYYCPNITMLGVRALAESCPRLECIGLPLHLVGPQLLRLHRRQVRFRTKREVGLTVVVQSIKV
jgi:hypothetical protein